MLLSLDLVSAKQVYKAVNYNLLVSCPCETMESMRAGGYYYYYFYYSEQACGLHNQVI